MLIVGCLLSPAGVPDGGEMPVMRANAAVTFICEHAGQAKEEGLMT